jgi:hypothetical protein
MKINKSKINSATYARPIPEVGQGHDIKLHANVTLNPLTGGSATTFEQAHKTGTRTTYIESENVSLQPTPGTMSKSPEYCPKVPA